MECSVLLLGPVGSGKTQAINTISDIDVVGTEATATDALALVKPNTTVAMDMGVLHLEHGDKVVLYGAPGQDRFDFMWDILLDRVQAIILLIKHVEPSALAELRHYLGEIRKRRTRRVPVVIGITHMDAGAASALLPYQREVHLHSQRCECELCNPPLFAVDPRRRGDMRALILATVAVLEMHTRFVPRQSCG